MISLQHLTVSHGTKVVLRDVSLDLEPSDVVCVLGEEGSGKSTFLKLFTREVQPNEGVIKIDTAFLSQLPKEVLRMYRTRIGTLQEQAVLDETLTIEQNIALPLDLLGAPLADRNRAVADLLKRFHLSGVSAMRPSQVSRGEQQLTAIARAIVTGPLIVLLDEPFQGLSDDAARLVANLLQNMQKKGTTIIAASAVERTATFFPSARIARLHRGKLTEEIQQVNHSMQRARTVAEGATSHLVERSTAVVHPVESDAPEHLPTSEKKKIRITSVGSL